MSLWVQFVEDLGHHSVLGFPDLDKRTSWVFNKAVTSLNIPDHDGKVHFYEVRPPPFFSTLGRLVVDPSISFSAYAQSSTYLALRTCCPALDCRIRSAPAASLLTRRPCSAPAGRRCGRS